MGWQAVSLRLSDANRHQRTQIVGRARLDMLLTRFSSLMTAPPHVCCSAFAYERILNFRGATRLDNKKADGAPRERARKIDGRGVESVFRAYRKDEECFAENLLCHFSEQC